MIVTALLLRYFFVTHQWQQHVRAEALSRIRSAASADPAALPVQQHEHDRGADAQRPAARRGGRRGPRRSRSARRCATRTARCGSRKSSSSRGSINGSKSCGSASGSTVRWDVAELPMRAFVPGLTVQPLLENAIYHGIEPLENGGTVTVSGRVVDGEVEIVVSNPVAPPRAGAERAQRATASRSRTSASGCDLAYGGRRRARGRAAAGPLPRHDPLPLRRMSASTA